MNIIFNMVHSFLTKELQNHRALKVLVNIT